MQYCNKQQRSALLTPNAGEKKAFQTLINSERIAHSANLETKVEVLKTNLMSAKKRSSATMLRRKLKGHIVRELNEI
ncbi:hypothetical protein E7W39_00790 [Cronobacter sakazakii]|uniref:Uncharacterized protein n=1 Tax=Cronobacter sakazakii TaxID=28141 RepID=A0A6A1TBK5_CROSK|nr:MULTISPECIES: hypothetical protein [Cronobacter]MDK1224425.1 hypothetical protein [Cronobacter turicensis]EGT4410523.1 hypothetical protein [Cronobacter sakazakii]EGZ6860479.1 hypothetical protein [Cronobacter sakazakii]EGZ6869866.1 hypothetical protein [Cronobacter sakazakii]EIZ8992688.1 hypothetical protein [Cronobacter sakazakii]